MPLASNVPIEPSRGRGKRLIQRPWFFEQMSRAWHNNQSGLALHARLRGSIERNHLSIVSAHNEQRWRLDARKRIACQIRTAAPGNDCGNVARLLGGRQECGACARACTKKPNRQVGCARLAARPFDGLRYPARQQRDVEYVSPVRALGGGQKVEQQRSEA
jgi:hypothetical protein